jgi:hypothetical protein
MLQYCADLIVYTSSICIPTTQSTSAIQPHVAQTYASFLAQRQGDSKRFDSVRSAGGCFPRKGQRAFDRRHPPTSGPKSNDKVKRQSMSWYPVFFKAKTAVSVPHQRTAGKALSAETTETALRRGTRDATLMTSTTTSSQTSPSRTATRNGQPGVNHQASTTGSLQGWRNLTSTVFRCLRSPPLQNSHPNFTQSAHGPQTCTTCMLQ